MSFTQDELQAFNSILEQRLSTQRRELERGFDQRFNLLKHDFEQRMESLQQGLLRKLAPRFAEQQQRLRESLDQRLQDQQVHITQTLHYEHEELQKQQQSQFEDLVERALAAQLLAIEQLISRHEDGFQPDYRDERIFQDEIHGHAIEAIEVQTEIPWEEVTDMFNKALDERMTYLTASLQESVRHMEQQVLSQVRLLVQKSEFPHMAQNHEHEDAPVQSMQDLLNGIEQLERIIESMQVAMSANHAFLSNRLFHHQQLPLERAHAHVRTPPTSASAPNSLSNLHTDLSFAKEPENV